MNNRKKIMLFISVALVIFLFIFIYAKIAYKNRALQNDKSTSLNSNTFNNFNAVIIDQLYLSIPDDNFLQTISKDLNNYGFNVIIYKGKQVNVNLFKNLPSLNPKLIIIRAHSGISTVNGKLVDKTYIFTNERYSHVKYTTEQLREELLPAKTSVNAPGYFAIGPKFITNEMNGSFHNTVVLMAGCTGLHAKDLAMAFIEKGAMCYLAWDASVGSDYLDKAVLNFIPNLLNPKNKIKDAVKETMNQIGPDKTYNAYLEYFPPPAGNSTFEDIVKGE